MTIEHHLLTGAALHNSKVLTFTGDPAAYVPPEAGILVCCLTSPNVGKLYRTTGTTAGAVALLATGQDGAAATVSVGDVTTGAAGSPAVVTNSGTASAAILDFELPRGATPAVTVGTVTGDVPVTVDNSGVAPDVVLDFAFDFAGLRVPTIASPPALPPDPLPPSGTAHLAIETATPPVLWVYTTAWAYVTLTVPA
jgi:hypothetical protein